MSAFASNDLPNSWTPLADMFWGDRYGQVTDPFGYRWSITHSLPQEK